MNFRRKTRKDRYRRAKGLLMILRFRRAIRHVNRFLDAFDEVLGPDTDITNPDLRVNSLENPATFTRKKKRRR
jgi:hypothetical protein